MVIPVFLLAIFLNLIIFAFEYEAYCLYSRYLLYAPVLWTEKGVQGTTAAS